MEGNIMTQEDLYFRPPSEAESFLIRVMRGCSHNKCTFCNIFKEVPLSILPLKEVLAGIDQDVDELGEKLLPLITGLYLEGGDPLVIPTSTLLCIIDYARSCFPALERVACYATAHSLVRKQPDELRVLCRAGLRRVYMGLESGNDDILKAVCKGCTTADLLRAAKALDYAGIENDVSLMLGIGGEEHSESHALDTAALLTAMRPACVRLTTYVPKEGTPLGEDYRQGRFRLLEPHAVLRELRLMVEHIDAPLRLLSNHWTNFIRFDANLPDDKQQVLDLIDQAPQLPRSVFRPTGMTAARG
jgi:radical SAM superfamily enzyme YgiQ (UPF0313 family)